MVQRPHILVVENDVRLWDERLAIRAHKALILHDVNQVPTMIAGLPLAKANQPTHFKCWASLIFATEHLFIGPVACFGAVRSHLTIYRIHDGIFADHTWDHTSPAAVRIHITNVFKSDGLVSIWLGHSRIVFPPLAFLFVPAWVLVFKPFKVFFGHGIDTPEVGKPASREELGGLMDITLVCDTVPGFLNVLVVNLQPIFL